MHFIEFENVCKFYTMGTQKITAADHISFYVEKGEFCVIVGPSGAGKTTVLNMLGGIDSCDEGRITLDGRIISNYSSKQLTAYRRLEVGFVFQFYNLVQNLTAIENVELASATFPPSFPAASSSGWPLPGPWLKTLKSCFVTSPPAPWTTTPARRCWGCSRKPAGKPGVRCW